MISSLSDKDQVKELIDRYGNEIAFVFVPLSECLRQNFLGHWIKWIFVQEEKDQFALYRTMWTLSPFRAKIEQNEDELKKILKDYERSIILDQRTLHD
jgi:protoheme ferro-lyase